MSNRDNQRQRLYNAEDCLEGRRVSRAATTHLIDTQTASNLSERDPDREPVQSKYGPLQPIRPAKVPTITAVQAYVDEVVSASWFQSRWGQRKISVRAGRGSHAGHREITVSQQHRRSEAVILHEIAHTLTPYDAAPHGPEFAGLLLLLVEKVMGKQHATDLRAAFKAHRVRTSRSAIPAAGTHPVVTKAQKAEKARARKRYLAEEQERLARLAVGPERCRKAAETIRARVKAGDFGAVGSKQRRAALDVARWLEA